MKAEDGKCRECGTRLSDKNAREVGYCIPCFAMMMADPEDEEDDFETCANCDIPDACADHGCAIKSGVRRNPPIDGVF